MNVRLFLDEVTKLAEWYEGWNEKTVNAIGKDRLDILANKAVGLGEKLQTPIVRSNTKFRQGIHRFVPKIINSIPGTLPGGGEAVTGALSRNNVRAVAGGILRNTAPKVMEEPLSAIVAGGLGAASTVWAPGVPAVGETAFKLLHSARNSEATGRFATGLRKLLR